MTIELLLLPSNDSAHNCVSVFEEQIPYARDVVDSHPWALPALIIGVLCTITVWALLAVQLFRIWLYRTIRSQTWVTRHVLLLLLFPTVTTTHLLAAFIPRAMVFCHFVANFYISIVLVQFFYQIMAYFGGEEQLLAQLRGQMVVQPICCRFDCCTCFQQEFDRSRLKRFKILILQYAFVQPFTAFLGTVLADNGDFHPGALTFVDAFVYLQAVTLISLFLCVSSMVRFNNTTSKVVDKRFRSPVKFTAIWIVLLVTNAQVFVFSIIGKFHVWRCFGVWSVPTISAWIAHFFAVYEMLLLSVIVHVYAFPSHLSLDKPRADDFQPSYVNSGDPESVAIGSPAHEFDPLLQQ